MHSAAFLALVASLVTSSYAAAIGYPRAERVVGQRTSAVNASVGLDKRDNIGGVYFCQGFGFQGPCLYQIAPAKNECVNLGPDFDNQISSFGPDICTECLVFDDVNCQGPVLRKFQGPDGSSGDGGVGTDADFDNKISSFSCDAFCAPQSAT
ncbi:hypothetical protein K466DRAFT_655114 [Polyporus arcularius HHB13444]|uniref:Uncharacterized protein n=1 Tax=Polyporus arcularius HHB13444 TaxID=1314778 RepID=A0A5C3P1Y5_9APHY|nr:hypothetical protein K466DRAFT_655114 [Polyporus arcularius HHB13444]